MGTLQWGNVAEWVGGLGTAGALMFAAWQIRLDMKASKRAADQTAQALNQTDLALKIQAERDHRDRMRREQTQASLIACLASRYRPNIDSREIHVQVWNRSSLPIYDVRAFVRSADGVALGEPREVEPARPELGANGRGEAVLTVGDNSANDAPPPAQYSGISFRDNAGLRWLKWADGHLLRASSADITRWSPTDTMMRPDDDPRLQHPDYRMLLTDGDSGPPIS